MNKTIRDEARERVGAYLASVRRDEALSPDGVARVAGLSVELVHRIESGSEPYSIDDFFAYVGAIDCYFYLANRDGHHLDPDDLMRKM